MKLCPACQRHLRAPEDRCPFCGAEQRSGADLSGTGLVASVVLSAMLAACGDRPATTSETGSTSTTGTTGTPTTSNTGAPTTAGPTSMTGPDGTTTATPTTDGSVSNSDSTLDTGDEGCAFYAGCPPDVGEGHKIECNVFAQDCRPGQKCTAWGYSDWTGTRCVTVNGTGKPGDACTAPEGPYAGIDDCQAGAMCWDVDEATMEGACTALCTGTPLDPMCAANSACFIANEAVLNLCLLPCDPLLQDCAGDDLCIPFGENFFCVFDDSGDGGQVNDPCELANSCDQGLVCLPSNAASSACMQGVSGCCQPFCDFVKMDPCPNPDQKCVQWYDPMMPIPPGSEDVGVCAKPQ